MTLFPLRFHQLKILMKSSTNIIPPETAINTANMHSAQTTEKRAALAPLTAVSTGQYITDGRGATAVNGPLFTDAASVICLRKLLHFYNRISFTT